MSLDEGVIVLDVALKLPVAIGVDCVEADVHLER